MMQVEKRLNQDFMVLIDVVDDQSAVIEDFDGKRLPTGLILHELCYALASETEDDIDPDQVNFVLTSKAPKARPAKKAKAKKAAPKPKPPSGSEP